MSFKATLATNTVYKIGNVLLLFLMTVVLSRAMGVEGYGLLSLLVLNGSLFNMFTSFGTDSGITYSTASGVKKIDRVVGITVIIVAGQLLLLLLIEALSFAFSGHAWLLGAGSLNGWWLALGFLAGISLQEKYAALLNGSHLYTQCNKAVLLGNLLSLLVIGFFFFVIKEKRFSVYITLFVLANLLQAFLLIVVSRHYLKFSIEIDFSADTWRVFFQYSVIAFITNCIQLLAYRADFWFIAYFRNETELGWYALAVRLVQLFWILPVLFASIIFPKVSAASRTYRHHEMLSLLRIMNTVNVLAGLLSVVLIAPLTKLVFGGQYAPAIPAFQILLPGIILFANATILAAYFAGMNELRVNLWGSVLCLVSIGLLDILLIPNYGYKGAALASSVGYALTAGYFILLYHRKSEQSISYLFVLQKDDWKQLRSWGKNFWERR